jgi:hypothetical protein
MVKSWGNNDYTLERAAERLIPYALGAQAMLVAMKVFGFGPVAAWSWPAVLAMLWVPLAAIPALMFAIVLILLGGGAICVACYTVVVIVRGLREGYRTARMTPIVKAHAAERNIPNELAVARVREQVANARPPTNPDDDPALQAALSYAERNGWNVTPRGD